MYPVSAFYTYHSFKYMRFFSYLELEEILPWIYLITSNISKPINICLFLDVYCFPQEFPENIVNEIIKNNNIKTAFIKNTTYNFNNPKINDADFLTAQELLRFERFRQSPLRRMPFSKSIFSDKCKKIKFIPLGIDFHTLTERESHWGKKQDAEQQVNYLNNIYKNCIKNVEERLQKIAVTFICSTDDPNITNITDCDKRINIVSKLFNKQFLTRQQIIVYLKYLNYIIKVDTSDRNQAWELMSKCAFTISPLGSGFDCHRTWEALYLGSIVIIPESPISNHFLDLGLPIVVISKLEDINLNNMKVWLKENKDKVTSKSTRKYLSSKYWENQLNDF